MQLSIQHRTHYRYSEALNYTIQQLRLTPRDGFGQRVKNWTIRVNGHLHRADDAFGNIAHLLVIDSPGGLVTDSHQIYHRLQKLQKEKPVNVQMKRMAASGGYYIAMGAGPKAKIFAEPTTWTGSIGVILPRYDFSKIAEQYGVASDPIKTGPYKDSLNPLRPRG